MSEELLVRHCAPTLAGMKTGNMFVGDFESETELRLTVRSWNRRLQAKGLCMLPLRFRGGRALLYVYRPARLRQDLTHETARMILNEHGYPEQGAGRCIARLIERVRENADFPHEIGLFLGYPPEDVRGFIEHKAENFKCVGTWKVYSDEQTAQKLFEKYRKCTSVYCRQWREGKSIERLTVAV